MVEYFSLSLPFSGQQNSVRDRPYLCLKYEIGMYVCYPLKQYLYFVVDLKHILMY